MADASNGRKPRIRRDRRPMRVLRTTLALGAIALLALALAASAGARVQSAGAKPLAETAPKITSQPSNTTVAEGSPASFTSTASGSPTPTVQWELSTDGGKTFAPIEGATSTTYTIPSTVVIESGRQFRAVFKNGAGTVTSKAVTLTVTAPPVVTLQPVDASAQEGKEATFKSEASGSPAPTIQWQQSTNGGETYKNLSGATQTTLKLIASKTLDNSKYRAVFKNSTGEVTSQAATLHLVEAPHIDIQPLSTTVTEGETAKFNSTAHGTPAPTVQWEVSTNGGSTFTPIEGATSTSLAFTATPEQDGYKYRAVWMNTAGTTTSNVVTLTVQGIPKVTEQPEDEVVLAGSSVTFEAQATGKPTPTVQWELSTNGGTSYAPIGGATSTTFTIASAQLSESGRLYRAVFKNTAGTATTRGALLTVATTDYRAYGWGQNNRSQTGTGGIFPVDAPLPIPNLSFVTQVSAGGRHSLALQAGGRVFAWGFNGHGQLGNEGAIGTGTPTAVENLSGVTAVAAGGNHSVALLSNGTVKDWGDGESGQLGDNKSTDSEVPVAVSGLSGVTEIAAGEEHTLALLEDGTVMAWGNNEVGQLGTGNTKNSDTPVAVKGLSGVTAIAAGGSFSMALLENGTVVDWGADQRHQLGNKALVEEELGEEFEESEAGPHSETPVPVDGLSNVKAIAAGRTHALALLNDGTVEAWGDDARGELGNGAIEETNVVASPVSGLSNVKTITAGERGSAAVLSSGAVMTWGTNEDGALGIGSEGEPSPVPVQASNIAQAVGISYGGGHVLAFGEAGPMVTGVSPNEGKMAGGDTVTITGVNFGSASAVHFGAASAATFKVESANTITATSPAGTGTVDVTVTTAAGTSPAKASDHFTYRQPPTVTKLSPKGGPATGGTVVTITGTGFTGVGGVSFGGVPASEFKVVSATSITATAPANAAGTAHVTVTTLGGTSASGTKDRYKYAPVVESVSPPSGPVAGGNTVTVTGAGFIAGINTVKFKFGKGSSKSVECTSANSCTVVVPAAKAAGIVDVTAQAAKVKGTLTAGYTFE